MLNATDLVTAFEQIIGWPYITPGTNDENGIDCSGAFVRAYRKHGFSIAHGSNTIYRKHCSETGWIGGDISRLVVGMAVFKHRADGGEPDKYRGDGHGNLYHIGLVTSTSPLRIVHATPPVAKADAVLGQWSHYGRLADVLYAESKGNLASIGVDSNMTAESAIVWAADGNPVKLRPTPGTDKPYLAKVPCGAAVTVFEQAAGWSQVSYLGKRGYMLTEFLIQGGAGGKITEVNGDTESKAGTSALAELAARVSELERLLAECSERLTACEEGGA